MRLVIAEKPSVTKSLAAVLGATSRKDGYLKGKFLRRFAQHYAAFDALLHISGNIYTHKVAQRFTDSPQLLTNY